MTARPTFVLRAASSACGLALCWLAAAALAAEQLDPYQLVEQTADRLAERVENDHKALSKDQAALYKLVDEVFLPVFDTRLAGRLVLGRHWRTATPEQQQAFIDAFYDFLLTSYAQSVLKFRRNNIRIFPPPPGEPYDPKRTIVRTEMALDDGSVAQVDYSLRLTKKHGWLIYDVNIEGLSYVQNYRKQYDLEISARGLDAVIARLREETPAMPSKHAGIGSDAGTAGSAEAPATAPAGGNQPPQDPTTREDKQ